MANIITINNIRELHRAFKLKAPEHPLVTLIDLSTIPIDRSIEGIKVVFNLYCIYKKDGCPAEMIYGRKSYDFDAGVMTFTSPGQVYQLVDIQEENRMTGWLLAFHPDLIRRSSLNKKIKDFTFFTYGASEALHASEREVDILNRIVKEIEFEYNSNLDNYSHGLINSSIELLLNYCNRFYNRQFITRKNSNKDAVEKFKEYLSERTDSESLKGKGIPTVKECAEKMCLSPNYLSDLLKKETGKSTKEYIHLYIIEKAKNMLLNTNETVNEIAYELGFEYPEYFSRLFKKRTGLSPSKFREEIEEGV